MARLDNEATSFWPTSNQINEISSFFVIHLYRKQRNMKTFRRMDRSSEAIVITILISIFSLFVSDVVCISHRFESQEVEVLHHHSSHLPIQPELVRTFEHCHKRASTFDLCIKNAFNELRVYFKTGKFVFPPIFT